MNTIHINKIRFQPYISSVHHRSGRLFVIIKYAGNVPIGDLCVDNENKPIATAVRYINRYKYYFRTEREIISHIKNLLIEKRSKYYGFNLGINKWYVKVKDLKDSRLNIIKFSNFDSKFEYQYSDTVVCQP